MTSILRELNDKWSEAALASRSGHEWRGVALSIAAPVRLLAAVREPDERRALLIETSMNAAPSTRVRFEAQGVSLVEYRRPSENIFRIAVTLERKELKDIFEALCADVAVVVSVAATASLVLAALTKRLEAWQACLRVRKGALSRDAQIGLLGELAVLTRFASVVGYSAAVEAWKGPLDGIHDFVAAGAAVEVKSVLGIGSHLHISHFDQLESSGLSSLTIARVRFREAHDGRSLPTYIQTTRRAISDASPATVPEFENKLLRAEYLDIDEPFYGDVGFVEDQLYCYAIRAEFPRITRKSLPPAVVDGTYTLDEKAISGFREDGDYLRRIVSISAGAEHG